MKKYAGSKRRGNPPTVIDWRELRVNGGGHPFTLVTRADGPPPFTKGGKETTAAAVFLAYPILDRQV